MTIRELPPPAPDARVIEKLEELLRQAKAGELRAFVACLVLSQTDDGRGSNSIGTSRAGKAHISSIIWALERAKLRLMGFVEDVDIDLSLGGTDR